MKSAAILLLGSAAGCAIKDKNQRRSIDGVKQIVAGVEDQEDASAFGQSRYEIDANHRLLLRYESFAQDADQVRTDDGHIVRALIAPADASTMVEMRAHLKICPLQHDWMMAATWKRAHPFSHAGYWNAAGGDFDLSECASSASEDQGFAVFDVTAWFLNYVRGRKQNYGLIIISDSPIQVMGEASGSFSPELSWTTSELGEVTTSAWARPSH